MKIITFLLIVAFCSFMNGQTAPDKSGELTSPGSSKLLTDWMGLHLRSIRVLNMPSHHFRQLAYTGVTFYESIVHGAPGYQPLAGQLNGLDALPEPTVEICWQASGNAAFAAILRSFYSVNPIVLKSIDSLEQVTMASLKSKGYDENEIHNGSEYGKMVAKAVFEWSRSDGFDKAAGPYDVPKGSGVWEPTPPAYAKAAFPYMGNCRTMVKGSIDNTIPDPPPAFSQESNSEFYRMVDEVYQSSLKMDESQTALALYWDDFPDGKTMTAGGHWESILRNVLVKMNPSLIEGARVFAGQYITMHDASVGCFKAKYTYNQIRPVTYIQKYMNHNDWNPLIATPNHPEYPAAHATISMSAATALTHLLGDNISFTDNTYKYRNYPDRHYGSFKEAGRDAGMSRFYGGIHYKPSIEAGFKQGEKIGNNVAKALVFRKQLATN